MNLLQMSFCGTVMIVVAALIRAVAIERLPKRTFLVLWGIIMLRLLVPFEIPSEFSIYSLVGYESVKESVDASVRENGWFDGTWDMLGAQDAMECKAVTVVEKSGQQTADAGTTGRQLAETDSGTVSQQSFQIGVMVNGQEVTLEGTVGMEQKEAAHTGSLAIFLKDIKNWMRNNVLLIVWGLGALLCAAFFILTYVRCRREFSMSLPVQNEFVAQWLKRRQLQGRRFFPGLCRRTQVRVSDRVDTPLTYGVFCPVILLPKKLEWEKTEQLEYILWHEYMHICHYDVVLKLLAVFVCCLHWFNPFVWLMHLFLNRDVELACDESVVRKKGVSGKSAYANILIGMEAKRNGIKPLCSNFSQNSIEKRIRAIMKIRKFSLGAVSFAMMLVMSVTVVFATSAVPEAEKDILANANFTAEESDMLEALRFDGYEDMSVLDFRNRVLAATSSDEYRELLNRFFMDKTLYEMRDRDKLSSFVFCALKPLTAQRWLEMIFSGIVLPGDTDVPQKEGQGLGYDITLYVSNANDLSVGEYADTVCGVSKALSQTMEGKSKKQLADRTYMEMEIRRAAERIQKEWSTYKLRVYIEFEYEPICRQEDAHSQEETEMWTKYYSGLGMSDEDAAKEIKGNSSATKEDYRAILSLMQAGDDYKEMPAAEFDQVFEEWSAKNDKTYDRIMNDVFRDDIPGNLSQEERHFLTHTVKLAALSSSTNSIYSFAGEAQSLECGISLALFYDKKPQGGQTAFAWDNMNCFLSYFVTDKDSVTVGERDRCVGGMLDAVERLWQEMDAGTALEMKNGEFHSKLVQLAKEYSSKNIFLSSVSSNYFLGWK